MKYKKYIFGAMIMVMALIFCGSSEVKAVEKYTGQAIWPSEYISNVFIKKEKPDGYIKWQQGRFIRRSEDNKFVYCLQPYVDINNNHVYNVTKEDYASVIGLTEEQWQRVSLLAYYGYGYGNHDDHKWYSITQVLIWRTVEPDSQIYFTDTLNGTRNDNLFKDEIAELEALVANHKLKPSFTIDSTTLNMGSSYTLTDNNGVLSKYTVTSSNNLEVTPSGNTLTIKPNAIGNGSISFKKTSNLYDSDPVLYYADGTQNVFRVGNVDPITMKLDFNVIGGKVTLHKLDRDTGENVPSGEATLKGAVYGIFDEGGNKLAEIKTSLDGTVQSDYLPYIGKYKIRELASSVGYLVDNTEYEFEITADNLFPDVTVYEQVIKRQIKIRKYFANGDTGVLNPEQNIVFEFYDKNNKMVAHVVTDKDGFATLNLPYGTYTGKQITTTEGHEKVDNFTVTINEKSPEVINLSFSNAPIQAKLKVVKIDKDTKQVIPRKGITFKIFDVTNNKYVCQTISYPKAETICEFKTDDNGILYTPYELTAGTYRLEEVDQRIDGYLWNKESKEFTIGDDSYFYVDNELGVIFEVQFDNKEVKGKVEVHKVGEKVVLKDNTFYYEEIDLDGVTYELYAEEDIYSANGVLKYKAGTLIGTYTSKDGYFSVEDLYLGKYYLIEKITVDNHVLDTAKHSFELVYKDQYTPVVTLSFTFKNYLEKSNFEFSKKNLVTGEPLPNTKIQIFSYTDDEENGTLIYEGVTDENGNITIKDLFVGKFWLCEVEAPEGYILNPEKMYFEITENGKVVKAEMVNEKIKSTVKLHKVDENNNPLAGVTIGVYDLENNLLGTYITDENGDIELELEYGSYYFKELATIDNYVLSDEMIFFDVTENGAVIETSLINVKVPNTNQNENYVFYIVTGLLSLAGIGMIIYDKKRKK